MGIFREGRDWARRAGLPVTVFLIVSLSVAALAFWFLRDRGIEDWVLATDSHTRPWSFLTYPWAVSPFATPFGLIFFIFVCLWLYTLCGHVEAELGWQRYAMLWLGLILVASLSLWLGANLLGARFAHAGPYLPLAAVTIVWCVRNPTTPVMLYGILPLSGKWLAILTAALVALPMGAQNPLLGVIALTPLGVGYLFASNRLGPLSFSPPRRMEQATRAQARYTDEYYDEVKRREKEREERERLRKLFESSLDDESK